MLPCGDKNVNHFSVYISVFSIFSHYTKCNQLPFMAFKARSEWIFSQINYQHEQFYWGTKGNRCRQKGIIEVMI
jgi:hypothetical protein